MATREEIVEEIRKLNDAIEGLETERRSVTIDKDERISIDGKITAKTGLLAIEKQRLLFLEQQGSATAQGGKTKTIYLCLPSEMKNGVPKILKYQWNSTDAMRKSVKNQGGGDLYRDVDSVTGVMDCVQSFDDLVDGSVYYLANGYYDAVLSNRTRAQVEDRVLEEQLSSALVEHLGGTADVYRGIKAKDEKGKDKAEFDRIVVRKGGVGLPANVLECALSPQVNDVQILLDKVEIFKLDVVPSSSDFRSVGPVVPVLGGRMWSEEVIHECKAKSEARVLGGMSPILRIQPSGKDFKVIREFSTFARTFLKRL